MPYKIFENEKVKIVRGKDLNYNFNKVTGYSETWAENKDTDVVVSPVGPLIADIEISTICLKNCKACYKSLTPNGTNMSLENFKTVLNSFPHTSSGNYFLQQIAIGAGSIDSCVDLFPILDYIRSQGIIPNITVSGHLFTEEHAKKFANVLGAIAVSHYSDDECFNCIEKLAHAKNQPGTTLKQINIHKLLSLESYDSCVDLLHKIKSDSRLVDLNAVVFLGLKPKGQRNIFHPLNDTKKFNELFELASSLGISVGYDSCNGPQMLKYAAENNKQEIVGCVQPCESTLESIYISADSEVFPCSFTEGNFGWLNGIKITEQTDFIKDVWNNQRIIDWRNRLLGSSVNCFNCPSQKSCRSCFEFDITPCKQSINSLYILP